MRRLPRHPATDVARAQAAAILAERAAFLAADLECTRPLHPFHSADCAAHPLHPFQVAALAGYFYDTPGEVNA